MSIKCLGLTLAAAVLVSACLDRDPTLPDTLFFAPGTPITYQGRPAKLYGTEACTQGQLAGHSCLIFPPHRTTTQAVIIAGQQVKEVSVTAKRDPDNPVQFVVVDAQGQRLLTTSGHNEEIANIEVIY